jgi:hypothetical protein
VLVSIGKGRGGDGDLVDLLLECHGRLRSFAGMARAAGERADLPAGERADACAPCANLGARAHGRGRSEACSLWRWTEQLFARVQTTIDRIILSGQARHGKWRLDGRAAAQIVP